jgi:hypothetical protein
LLSSCEKNEVSKIPQIGFLQFSPSIIKAGRDTAFMQFSIRDGDADLGVSPGANKYDIYIKDLRFDSANFVGYLFPGIDPGILDPTKGITGTCTFLFIPKLLYARTDSPMHYRYDTARFEVYIMDRAGNNSNPIITDPLVMQR